MIIKNKFPNIYQEIHKSIAKRHENIKKCFEKIYSYYRKKIDQNKKFQSYSLVLYQLLKEISLVIDSQ